MDLLALPVRTPEPRAGLKMKLLLGKSRQSLLVLCVEAPSSPNLSAFYEGKALRHAANLLKACGRQKLDFSCAEKSRTSASRKQSKQWKLWKYIHSDRNSKCSMHSHQASFRSPSTAGSGGTAQIFRELVQCLSGTSPVNTGRK